MAKQTLKERLVKWLKAQKGWVPSGELQRVVAQSTSYTPQNVGRRMRELENEGIVEVKYIKGHAHYRIPQAPKPYSEEDLERIYQSL